MIIYGNLFTVVRVDILPATSPSPSGGGAIWSTTNYGGNSDLIAESALTNYDATKGITVKISGTPFSWGWGNIDICKNTDGWPAVVTAHSSTTPEYYNAKEGCVSIPVTVSQLSEIFSTGGMRIGIYNFNVTMVELLQ